MDVEKLRQMAGASGASAQRLGGKGTMRRKKKIVHKSSGTDDKKLQATLKRVGVNTIPGIEEVNIFQGDSVITFASPKVQASIAANTFVVSGPSQTKPASEYQPSAADLQQLMAQMGAAGVDMAQLQKMMAGGMGGAGAEGAEDDDDVPDLVENFEEAAAEGEAAK